MSCVKASLPEVNQFAGNCFHIVLKKPSYAGAFSEERKFEIIGHLQQMVHDTHEFYSKIINEILHLSVLLLRLPLKTHI